MASVKKITWTNKDGTTGKNFRVAYKDAKGRRRYKSFDSNKAAKAYADTVGADVKAGTHVHDRDTVTIAEGADNWIAACRRGRDGREPVEPSTLRMYEQHIRNHIKPILGALKFSQLTKQRVIQFRDVDMLDGGRSRDMTKKVLASLSAICAEAVLSGLIPINPCIGVTIVTSGRHKEEVVIPTKGQVVALLAMAESWANDPPRATARRGDKIVSVQPRFSRHRALWWYATLRFIASTGARSSEVRGAWLPDLDVPKEAYSVNQRADEKGIIGPPKSAAGYRTLELSPGLVIVLQRWLEVAPNIEIEVTRNKTKVVGKLLFPAANGSPENLRNIYRRFWYPLMVACGIGKEIDKGRDAKGQRILEHEMPFSLHDLRHFHASQLIEGGMGLKELSEHMGHASVQMTMDLYGHLFHDDVAKKRRRTIIVDQVDGLLDAKPIAATKLLQNGKI